MTSTPQPFSSRLGPLQAAVHLWDERSVESALGRAVGHLLRLQDSKHGYWWAELEANTSLTSEFVFLMHMLGRVDPDKEAGATAELLAEQRPDGGYLIYAGGPSNLSTTVEAYVALKLMGHDPSSEPLQRARAFILAHGGVSKSRVFTKIHLAMLGLYDYRGTPSLPPWLLLFPDRFALSIYQMSSWARSCVVPLVVLMDKKPDWSVEGLGIDELYAEGKDTARYEWAYNPRSGVSWENFFVLADRTLRRLHEKGWVPFRRRGVAEAERWILSHQDEEGDWGGIIPAMAYSLLALKALGYDTEHPVMKNGWAAIERFGIHVRGRFRLQSCVSPVWDTSLAMWALEEASVPGEHPALQRAARWLLGKQVVHYGDWAIKNRRGRPGGWSFELVNRYYPDCDDSTVGVLALRGVDLGKDEAFKEATIVRAREWVLSMQCQTGGWAAFDVDNDQALWNEIPFADHKAMLDPSAADLTGRVVEMLGASGYDLSDPVVDRAVRFLLRTQEVDGSWYGRWGVNYVYGTWAVLCGLCRVGFGAEHVSVRRAVAFLERVQNEDGGWGESCTSYDEGRFVPAASCASQTAWAVMGLLAAGRVRSRAVERGIDWLIDSQMPDGSWNEEQFTGTGFPRHFYIRYHLYRDCFSTMALGQYARAKQ